jgi:hypothetical protein
MSDCKLTPEKRETINSVKELVNQQHLRKFCPQITDVEIKCESYKAFDFRNEDNNEGLAVVDIETLEYLFELIPEAKDGQTFADFVKARLIDVSASLKSYSNTKLVMQSLDKMNKEIRNVHHIEIMRTSIKNFGLYDTEPNETYGED